EKFGWILNVLESSYNGDITIANVIENIKVEKPGEFYDLTIPEAANFMANGLVVHNSQRRYQRIIEEEIEYYYKKIGEAMDDAFLNRVKGVIVGGPGPAKDGFIKLNHFNYQIKIMGVVDAGYTDEYGVREVLAKSESILSQQEAVKEKVLVDRFIKEVVTDGLATYGEKEVRNAIVTKQAELVLLSEGLTHTTGTYKCAGCENEAKKASRDKHEDTIECENCHAQMKLQKEEPLIEELDELAKSLEIKVEIVSTNTTEGNQFFTGFGGIGAMLRYKLR
ncbi:hypothetical protein HZC07_05795, partial [Candidatus Micrarchaeota archaeon]|nr:hypothetical protein [Candidatus Micrarchaeota archaeon]